MHSVHGCTLSALSLVFISMVLIPYFDLCRSEVDRLCKLLAFCGREVVLFAETFLKFLCLRFREKNTALAFYQLRCRLQVRWVFIRGGRPRQVDFDNSFTCRIIIKKESSAVILLG